MTMTALPSDPQSAGDDRNPAGVDQAPIVLTFEDKLQLFWRRHSALVVIFCVAVLAVIVGVGIWEYQQDKNEKKLQAAYTAVTTPEGLKAFADANPGHPLSGVAYLRLADDAFAAGKTSEALANYEKAAGVFKEGPFAARTKLGLAVTKIVGGKTAEGATELKQLADDVNQLKGVRVEAGYHLASLAAEAGTAADVQKYSELLMQIDPTSPWTNRALELRANLPAPAVTEPAKDASAAPAIQFGPAKK